jgi:hypothetical protein
MVLYPVLWIRIRIRIRIGSGWGPWIRIRIHNPDPDTGGQKWPGCSKISSFEVLDVLFRGLKASPVAWTYFMAA